MNSRHVKLAVIGLVLGCLAFSYADYIFAQNNVAVEKKVINQDKKKKQAQTKSTSNQATSNKNNKAANRKAVESKYPKKKGQGDAKSKSKQILQQAPNQKNNLSPSRSVNDSVSKQPVAPKNTKRRSKATPTNGKAKNTTPQGRTLVDNKKSLSAPADNKKSSSAPTSAPALVTQPNSAPQNNPQSPTNLNKSAGKPSVKSPNKNAAKNRDKNKSKVTSSAPPSKNNIATPDGGKMKQVAPAISGAVITATGQGLVADPPVAALKKIVIENTPSKDKSSGVNNDGAKIILTFDNPIAYRVFTLDNPARIAIDMAGKVSANNVAMPNNLWIKKYRLVSQDVEASRAGLSRLVLDMNAPVQVSDLSQSMPASENKLDMPAVMAINVSINRSKKMAVFKKESQNWAAATKQKKSPTVSKDAIAGLITKHDQAPSSTRQQIDSLIGRSDGNLTASQSKVNQNTTANKKLLNEIIKNNSDERGKGRVERIAEGSPPGSEQASVPVSIQPLGKNNSQNLERAIKPLIAIDAGHGGVDSGAIGLRGTVEALVNLAAAKQVAKTLEESGRYRVFLTRKGDYFIPLRERYRLAEKAKADFFISIHTDSFPDSNVLGASIYTLSDVASDKETARLAEKENKSDNYASFFERGLPFDARIILLGLGQRQKDIQSNIFANLVAKKFPPTVPFLKSKPHRFAAFTVMKSIIMPSVLFEMGFISSEQQERQIVSPEFRANVARCMLRAFDEYFYDIKMKKGCS